MPANPRPWTYRKTYVGSSPFLTISDANGQPFAYLTLWPENVEANARLICEAVNAAPVETVTGFNLTTEPSEVA
jgi:hypothetical protein